MTAASWDARTWDMVQSGPADADSTVLLLPGGWCTAVFYRELMAEPALAGIRLVAVTLPGNGGTRAPQDLSVENYARLTAELAERLGCTAVVGHSMGANVALEMAGSGAFTGPVVLLAPSFSRRDEALVVRVVDRLARVLGRLPYRAMRFMMRFAVKGSPLPRERLAELVSELQKNDPEFMRRGMHRYLQYLDRHGSVDQRLCAAAVPAWVVHGQTGDGGITDEERRTLQAYPWIRIVTLPGGSFFTPNEEPALVAGLVVAALHAATIQPTTN
jgi:pimeloyl-ACP methyl ester carboxylesterase